MRKQFLIGLAVAAIAVHSGVHDSGAAGIIAAGNAVEFAPQVSNERGVKVMVTRKNFLSETQIWDFQVVLETHAQDLGDDLARSSVLVADGKRYLPLAWEGAPPGGHHRKGLLRFKAIVPQPRAMELQIRLAGDAAPRSFKWSSK
jgi:hypothetical protein